MNTLVSDEGMVLRVRPYKEYDAFVTIVSRLSGKETFLAKGLRRPNSKRIGIVQPLTGIRFFVSPSRSGGIGVLMRTEAIFLNMHVSHSSVFFLVEVIEHICAEGEGIEELFFFFQEVFSQKRRRNFLAFFLLRMLTLLGHIPLYGRCHDAGTLLTDGAIWSSTAEMYAFGSKNIGISLSSTEIKIIRFWQQASPQGAQRVLTSIETEQKILRFLIHFLEEHLHASFRTTALMWECYGDEEGVF